MHGTAIEWINECKGICRCPNAASHSGSSKSECVIWIDGNFEPSGSVQWPTKKCAHSHCQEHPLIKLFNHELRSRIARAEHREDSSTPNAYLKSLYPDLAEKYGDPIDCRWSKQGICRPVALNERFFAALLVREGNDKSPATFDLEENIWLRYCPAGFYKQLKAETLHELLGGLLLEVARNCKAPNVDTGPLQFCLRSTRVLSPVVTKASGVACVSSDIWDWPPSRIPVANGVLDIEQSKLLPHSPDNYFRGVVPIDYAPGAGCPMWVDLLSKRVQPDDAELIQQILALILTGRNSAQVLTLLYGAAGSSKGTIVRVLVGLAGASNAGTLRTSKLDGRFEMGRHRHKLLLYGPDVDEDFLNNQGAALLKAITGEDPISPEYKNSNVTPPAKPVKASVIMTANSRLRIRFQGDKEAWRRRLIIIPFEDEVPEAERVPGFSQKLLDSQGSGILNWGLDGVRKLVAHGGKIVLTERQKKNRDALLDESEAAVAFARERVEREARGRLLAARAYEQYVKFCTERGWAPETPQRFLTEFKRAVVDMYGITQATDLPGCNGNVRGWRGLRLKSEAGAFNEDDER